MLSKKLIVLFILLIISTSGYSQPSEEEVEYFLFPINPGVRNTLAGTMGELRTSHFHTGIDIRTGGRQGLPVRAAADGYISRISVSGGGYGNALYITHPNGKITVYAHLKEFKNDVERFVRKKQYKKQSFEVNLFPKPEEFRISKGDTIALSGNSGSSGGPHLHFDIRDKNQDLLNPLHFNFEEIIDTRTPYAKSVALVPFDINSRIEGIFDRKEFKVTSKEGEYILEDTVSAFGELGLEVYAWDRMNGTRFKTGINQLSFRLNEELLFEQTLDTWSFANARSFYQHINYESLVDTRQRFHKLYVENGNSLKFYKQFPGNGRFIIEDGEIYHASVNLIDSYGNQSTVKLIIRGDRNAKRKDAANEKPYSLKIVKNTLRLVGDSLSGNIANLNVEDEIKLLKSSYTSKGYPVFLWDLRESIPGSIALRDTVIHTNIISMVPAKQEFVAFNSHTDIKFNKRSLFDTLYLNLSYQEDTINGIELLSIGNPKIPLKGPISVHYKPGDEILDLEHSAIYQVYGKNQYGYVGGDWKNNQIEFSTRSFGNFAILQDTIPPSIKPLIINRKKIYFELNDDLSGLNKIEASLNGNWLLIAKDPKKKLYWAEKQFEDQKFSGELILKVSDNASNVKEYKTTIR